MGAVGDDVGDDDKGVFGGVEGRVSCLLVRWTAHVWSLVVSVRCVILVLQMHPKLDALSLNACMRTSYSRNSACFST